MEQQQSLPRPVLPPVPITPTARKRKRKPVIYSAVALGNMRKGRLITLVMNLQEELMHMENASKGLPSEKKIDGKPGAGKLEEVSTSDRVRLATKKLIEKIVKQISTTSMTTATNTMFRPYVTVEMEMEGDVAIAIVGNFGVEKKNSHRYLVRSLDHSDLQDMLPDLPEQCDVMYSAEASLMTTATLQTMEFKFDKKYAKLVLKIRIARARGAGIFSTAELFDDPPSEGEQKEKESEKDNESTNKPQKTQAPSSAPATNPSAPAPTPASESTTTTPGAAATAKSSPAVNSD